MIQLRRKAATKVPHVLTSLGTAASTTMQNAYDAGERGFEFDKDIYGHPTVKQALIDLQGHKCCFCEAKITHVASGDVEHYRPKAGWTQAGEKLSKPGYYWLAYNWDNLFLSCEICNRRNKKNYFPLLNPTARAKSHHDTITQEQPAFLHPVNDDPEQHITFKAGAEDVPVGISNRGRETVKQLGIDREELNEHRRTTLEKVRDLYGLAKDCPPTDVQVKDRARAVILRYKTQSEQDDTEYASMLRCFFRNNPIDF